MMNQTTTDVFLVNPPASESQRQGPIKEIISNLFFNSPPLGLAYVAAVLERAGVDVRLLDAGVHNLGMAETVSMIIGARPRLLGITATSNFFGNALELARRVKVGLPDVFVVLGGPHGTSCADEVMLHHGFDAVVVGEGEDTVLELTEVVLGGGELGDVKGIVFRDGDDIVRNPSRPLIKNLDDLPLPARHLLPLDKYVPQPNDAPYLPKQAMITSRGCPYQCTFCDHGTYGVSYRSFSPDRIAEEMQELVTRYGVRDIAFVDSLFMVSKERVRRIIEAMRERRVEVHWTCTIRANIVDRAILQEMKAAGCWRVRIGIESGSSRVLEAIRKEVELDEVREAVEIADELGLHPKAFFIIGHPTETRESVIESIRLACRLPLTDITVQLNTPLPGSAQWYTAAEHGDFTTPDWTRYSFWEPVYIPHGMSARELDQLYRKFYQRFYYRPITVRRHMKMFKSWRDISRFIRGGRILASMTTTWLRRD